jgi:hypothetical protein
MSINERCELDRFSGLGRSEDYRPKMFSYGLVMGAFRRLAPFCVCGLNVLAAQFLTTEESRGPGQIKNLGQFHFQFDLSIPIFQISFLFSRKLKI